MNCQIISKKRSPPHCSRKLYRHTLLISIQKSSFTSHLTQLLCIRTMLVTVIITLRKVLYRRRHVETGHHKPSKLTHFLDCFDKNSLLSLSKFLCESVNLHGYRGLVSTSHFQCRLNLGAE